ncbi:hypothetical protein SCP_0313000 [Sparassis crispa]|uniref:Sister chromatid cohesion protein n=1 Tax=Sparassis crispa TaxID=139825 RepID=A0A401GHH8_9APHY|nr:hypothetical protein SCP_0313000 [Sparassis crispa]GBE81571.1 hypothetical protein SCP_0313000 [Sparassis crispa]
MTEYTLKFSASPLQDTGSFRLLELPPDLCRLIESAPDSNPRMAIKGQPNEDAVLCTPDKTYTIRSVVLSNSILVVTPPQDEEEVFSQQSGRPSAAGDVVIRDQLSEILELVPSVPKLHKLDGLLRGQEYDEGHEDEILSDVDEERPRKRQKLTYDTARATLQASDLELDRGLRNKRVLVLNGALRPIAPSHLTTILELLLNYLVSLSLPHDAASAEELSAALEDRHEIKREVTMQVMAWFGDVTDKKWKMDVAAVVKEVGLGVLRAFKDDPIPQEEFLSKWRNAVGDTFEMQVALDLLSGNYLSQLSPITDPPITLLVYFPSSSLPVDSAARFTDLFLTRPRWKAAEISPFLADIVVDSKERDRLLLKFARAVTDAEGVWYTARAKYNG